MPEQLSLLAPHSGTEPIVVVVDRLVLAHGSRAPSVPRHRDGGALGRASAATATGMLDLAEDALRYNQAPDPRLRIDPQKRRRLGSNGPMGRDSLMADSSGIRDFKTGESATWPQLLRALAAQRQDEPHIARARDLAEAYHYLSYYRRAYGPPADAPPALLEGLRIAIRELGGNPDAISL